MTTLVGWGTVEWGLMSADFEEMPCSPSTSMGQLQVARPGALLGGHQGGGNSCQGNPAGWLGQLGGRRRGEGWRVTSVLQIPAKPLMVKAGDGARAFRTLDTNERKAGMRARQSEKTVLRNQKSRGLKAPGKEPKEKEGGLLWMWNLNFMVEKGSGNIFDILIWASQVARVVKNPPANAGDKRDAGSTCGLGRSPGGGHGNPLWYSCLENPIDRGAWRARVHRVAKSQT